MQLALASSGGADGCLPAGFENHGTADATQDEGVGRVNAFRHWRSGVEILTVRTERSFGASREMPTVGPRTLLGYDKLDVEDKLTLLFSEDERESLFIVITKDIAKHRLYKYMQTNLSSAYSGNLSFI
jgi:hypothetical protein